MIETAMIHFDTKLIRFFSEYRLEMQYVYNKHMYTIHNKHSKRFDSQNEQS